MGGKKEAKIDLVQNSCSYLRLQGSGEFQTLGLNEGSVFSLLV